jgi:Flp pilus assembly pilin Flp
MQGWGTFLNISGALFILAALARVVAEIRLAFAQTTKAVNPSFAADDLKAAASLVEAVGKLPPYALTALIGVVLIACGSRLAAGLQVWP